MNVEFSPEYVKEYRLIGFDNKVGAINDSLAIVEGGEIGSGYSMMGIFEIQPVTPVASAQGKFATIRLRYKYPNDTTRRQFSYNSAYNYQPFDSLGKHYRFSAAVAMFGSLLRNSAFTRTVDWNNLLLQATASADMNDLLQKEFVTLVTQAKELYAKNKKKKKKKSEDE
jgi:Ca-activated chloride channel family protein